MKKVLLFLFLFTASVITTQTTIAQSTPSTEIKNPPPQIVNARTEFLSGFAIPSSQPGFIVYEETYFVESGVFRVYLENTYVIILGVWTRFPPVNLYVSPNGTILRYEFAY